VVGTTIRKQSIGKKEEGGVKRRWLIRRWVRRETSGTMKSGVGWRKSEYLIGSSAGSEKGREGVWPAALNQLSLVRALVEKISPRRVR
jgi:hypothetical protein